MGKRGSLVSKKRGQIWVETVIYTLIAFALIGLVLAFARPKIQELQDSGIIDQSIGVLQEIDSVITDVKTGGPGNQRVITLGISKGTLNVDGQNDKIFFEIESKSEYSEQGENVVEGNVIVSTQKSGDVYDVTLTRDFAASHDITFENLNEIKILERSSTPYRISISNEGTSNGKTIINVEVVS